MIIETMRDDFEGWHRKQYATKHMTGAPTRDMHGGVYDEKYGPPKQQALWECWQETGGDVAKVEALKEEYEQKEAGDKPVGYLDLIPRGDFGFRSIKCSPHAYYKIPVYTRSDAGEVERLREELASANQCAMTYSEQAIKLQEFLAAAEQRNADLSSTLEECITEMSLALQDHAVRSAMTVVGRTRFLKLVQDYNTQPAESGAST